MNTIWLIIQAGRQIFALMLNELFSNNSAYISKQIPYIVNYYNYSHNTVRPGSSYPNLYNKLLYNLDQPLTGHTVPHTSMGETHHMIHLFIIISSFLSVHKIWILLSSVSRGLLQVRDKVAFRKWIYWEKKKISWIKRNF